MSEEETPWTKDQWREWVREESAPYHLEEECLALFDAYCETGDHPSIAAQDALAEWDLWA